MPPQNFAVRLRKPYDSLRQAISAWSLECSKVVAYEHPEDGNIHCHLALMGYYGSKQHLKDVLASHGCTFKPDEWSFKESFKAPGSKTCVPITEDTLPGYITYMSKGKYDPKYLKGVTEEFCAEQKAKWVDYKQHAPKSADRLLLDEFMAACWKADNEYGKVTDVKAIRSKAFSFAIGKMDGVINMQCRKMAKMLVDSYCYAERIIKLKDLALPFEEIPKAK